MSTNEKRPVAVVTGANRGIGRIVAARLGLTHHVILACRSEEKGKQAEKELKSTGRTAEFLATCDTANPQSCVAFATALQERFTKVDLLVLNAGTCHDKFSTPEVFDAKGASMTFCTNHLGNHVLVETLIPLLETSRSRVILISSNGSDWDPKRSGWHPIFGPLDFEKSWNDETKEFTTPLLSGETSWDETKSYCETKLCNILQCKRLARKHSQLTVAAVCPGLCPTTDFPMFRGFFGIIARNIMSLIPNIVNTMQEAGSVVVEACLRNDIKTGTFYNTGPDVTTPAREEMGLPCVFGEHPNNPQADDEAVQDKLYEICNTIWGR
mmetsp:Transcript_16413/g.21777  ORF Transcript_16413/g.21777 Transcript_16413/m.21777 type:complete len:325 (-) Transcript_16413:202-1176(-)